jgi:hypothetical protein
MRCKCGTVLRDDNPDLDYLMLSQREFDVGVDGAMLLRRARDVWSCWTCGRLWVFWEAGGEPSEYLPVSDNMA